MQRANPPLVGREGEGERGALYALTPDGMVAALEYKSKGASTP